MINYEGITPKRSIIRFSRELPKEILEYSPIKITITGTNEILSTPNTNKKIIIGVFNQNSEPSIDDLEDTFQKYNLRGISSYKTTEDSIIVNSNKESKTIINSDIYSRNATNNILVFLGEKIENPYKQESNLETLCSITNFSKEIVQGVIDLLKKKEIIYTKLK